MDNWLIHFAPASIMFSQPLSPTKNHMIVLVFLHISYFEL